MLAIFRIQVNCEGCLHSTVEAYNNNYLTT